MSGSDPEVEFFRDIERAFIERRGHPLFISNADWVYLARLRKRGIPKRIILRGLTDAFDAHAHSFARKQRVRSLRFCEPQIDAAVERYRRAARADGSPGARGLRGALLNLASRLDAASSPGALGMEVARVREALEAASRGPSLDPAAAEALTAGLEESLATAARAQAGADEVSRLEAESRKATETFAQRMPGRVYEELIAEATRRKLLASFGLPRLLLAEAE